VEGGAVGLVIKTMIDLLAGSSIAPDGNLDFFVDINARHIAVWRLQELGQV